MRITELEEEGSESCKRSEIVSTSTKRVLVGAGARILFYPTLLYNVIRNKIQAEFRWWDEIDQFKEGVLLSIAKISWVTKPNKGCLKSKIFKNQYLLLGAVPFPKDVLLLQQLGVRGVVTLNESYETLVPSSLYRIEYRNMRPTDALEYVRSIRPRVLLAPSQWRAVQEYDKRKTEFPSLRSCIQRSSPANDIVVISEVDIKGYITGDDSSKTIISYQAEKLKPVCHSSLEPAAGDEVLITYEDLEGYDGSSDKISKDWRKSSTNRITSLSPVVSRLSCFFATFKLSGSGPPPSGRLQEVRAC
ncbi:Putative dual specificity protein phosphatase DSP8 [Apostasia shenzhenica]|uniref:Dual specificity protein phosphatase DSP8 n=1 Tax=Apostasia shenzhenica TaxID=1088818 RepID=A0A2I0BBZ3_9ASPA|nr:Putative dual specificity protein phosphatase DSP8 [Apostasia shenzhenica]